MWNVPTALEAMAASVLLVVCSLAIWHNGYQDTLTQRVGLAFTGAFSAFLLAGYVMGMPTRPALTGLILGSSIFAWGCFLKYRRIWLRVPPQFRSRGAKWPR